MRKVGFIFITIAVLSLFGAMLSAGRDANAAGGKLVGAIILAAIGGILVFLGNKKETSTQKLSRPSRQAAFTPSSKENTQQSYKHLNPTVNKVTEDTQKTTTQTNENNMKFRNRMSARELITRENSKLDFVENPNTGKIFFVCGSKKGYVSPAAKEHMENGELDDFCYAEVSADGIKYIPCLMLVNKPTEKVVRSFDIPANTKDNDLPF